MAHFRKIWTAELNEWLKSTKGMGVQEAYDLFLATFPEITDVTRTAFCNQRSRMKAAGVCTNPNFSRKPRPLYSEHIKKGYVRIKIAQPNVWVSKAKWVYMETHPWEDFSERSNYIFLDGDSRNFSPDNIERVPLRLMGIFNKLGGTEKGSPEISRLRLVQAKHKDALLSRGEKCGLVHKYGNYRCFLDHKAAKRREFYSKNKEKCKAYAKKHYETIMADPLKHEKLKEYIRQYYRRRKG